MSLTSSYYFKFLYFCFVKHSIVATPKWVPCLPVKAPVFHLAGNNIIHSLFYKKCILKVHWDLSSKDKSMEYGTLWNIGSIMLQWIVTEKRMKYDWRSSSNKYGLIRQKQQGTKLRFSQGEKQYPQFCAKVLLSVSEYNIYHFCSKKPIKHLLDTNHSLVRFRFQYFNLPTSVKA